MLLVVFFSMPEHFCMFNQCASSGFSVSPVFLHVDLFLLLFCVVFSHIFLKEKILIRVSFKFA